MDSSQRLLIHFVIPWWFCSQRNRRKTALRACSSSGLEKVSSLHLVSLLPSDDPEPWDARDLVVVEASLCLRKFQDLAKSGRLEPEASICFLTSDASHKAPNHLFNICNLSRLGGHCLSKRLDEILDPGRVLREER